jgi:hypothetical protein
MLLKCEYVDEVAQGRSEVTVLIYSSQCNTMPQRNIVTLHRRLFFSEHLTVRAEENIWTKEGLSEGKLEKTA